MPRSLHRKTPPADTGLTYDNKQRTNIAKRKDDGKGIPHAKIYAVGRINKFQL